MRRLASFCMSLCLAAAAAPAAASCTGDDPRASLAPAEHAELESRLDGMPYARGNHWRARKGPLDIHVLGTTHLADPRVAPAADRLAPLVGTAGRLLLELTAQDRAELEAELGGARDLLRLEGPPLPDLLSAPDWQALTAAAAARGVSAAEATRLRPWVLTTLLTMPPCAAPAGPAGPGLDARLMAAARAAGTPMAPLEDARTVLDLYGGAPLEVQLAALRATLAAPPETEKTFAALLDLYFDERPAESWALMRILSRRGTSLPPAAADMAFDRLEDRLLIERNRDWLPVILSAAEEVAPEPLVVAAGAAHLPGHNGLLTLLERAGFTIERSAF